MDPTSVVLSIEYFVTLNDEILILGVFFTYILQYVIVES